MRKHLPPAADGHKTRYSSRQDSAHVLLLTPIYPPVAGGGAQYSEFLANHLHKTGLVESLEVLTERHPGEARESVCNNQSTAIRRRLVRFNSLPTRLKRRYIAYAVQNFQLAKELMARAINLQRNQPKILLIHGAFFIHPTALTGLTKLLKWIGGDQIKLVIDVRDPSAPLNRLKHLNHFDLIITCSRRLTRRIQKIRDLRVPVIEIPVPFQSIPVSQEDVKTALGRHNLRQGSYLLATQGIKNDREFPLIFKTWQTMTGKGYDLDLAVAGYNRDWSPQYASFLNRKQRLLCLGSLPNQEIRALMKGAAAVINPSRKEGMPRTCLEAISVGTPVLLPPEVPEFERMDPRFVAMSTSPGDLADQVLWMIKEQRVPPYNIAAHRTSAVLEHYRGATAILLSNSGRSRAT